MPSQELLVAQPPGVELENEETPASQPIVGIIYPPPEVRSMLNLLNSNFLYTFQI